MGQNRTTASIGLAVALSLALGGAGGYLLGREHAPAPGPVAAETTDCAGVDEVIDEMLEERDAVGESGLPAHEAQAEEEHLTVKIMTVVDQNPDCFDAHLRATASTYLEDQRQGAAQEDTQRIIDCMKDTAPYGC